MRLICPRCGAQYEIDAALLPAAGRDVECSGCNHVWHQPGQPLIAPVKALPKPLPEASAAPLSRPLSTTVLNILREEAEREQAARAAEAQADLDPATEPEAAQAQETATIALPQVYVDEDAEDADPDDSDDWPATTIITASDVSAPGSSVTQTEATAPQSAPAKTPRPALSRPSAAQTSITSQPAATDTTPEPTPIRRPIHRVRPNTLPDADQLAATLVPPVAASLTDPTAAASPQTAPQAQTTTPAANRYAAGFTTALAMLALLLALYLVGGTQPHDSPLGQLRDTLDQARAALTGLFRG